MAASPFATACRLELAAGSVGRAVTPAIEALAVTLATATTRLPRTIEDVQHRYFGHVGLSLSLLLRSSIGSSKCCAQ